MIRHVGVPLVHLHDLRQTPAALLLRGGTPIKLVSERLGHSRTSTNLEIYARCLREMQDRVGKRPTARYSERLPDHLDEQLREIIPEAGVQA